MSDLRDAVQCRLCGGVGRKWDKSGGEDAIKNVRVVISSPFLLLFSFKVVDILLFLLYFRHRVVNECRFA